MNLDKEIYKLTSVLLRLNPALFCLLIFFVSGRWSRQSDVDHYYILNIVLHSVSMLIVVCWVFAIAHKSNERLHRQGITFQFLRHLGLAVISGLISYIILVIISPETIYHHSYFQLPVTKLSILPFIFIPAFLFIKYAAAKALVSAEKNKPAHFEEVFFTFFLLTIPMIGVLIIQPRIQRI